MKLLIALCCALVLHAETRQEKGRRLIDETVAALGGDKFLSVKDRVEIGRAYSFYRERLTGLAVAKIQTVYTEKAGANGLLQRERQSYGKEEDYLVLFTDKGGYQITYRGARPLPDDRYTRYLESTRRNFFYILRNRLDEPGMIFEAKETTVWMNTPVEIVDIIDADNNTVTVYLHRTTKLPVRQIFIRRDPKTKERNEEVSIYSKYRDVGGGVQWPFSVMAERNGEKVFELYSDSVAVNQGLNESLFQIPSGLKELPPEK